MADDFPNRSKFRFCKKCLYIAMEIPTTIPGYSAQYQFNYNQPSGYVISLPAVQALQFTHLYRLREMNIIQIMAVCTNIPDYPYRLHITFKSTQIFNIASLFRKSLSK